MKRTEEGMHLMRMAVGHTLSDCSKSEEILTAADFMANRIFITAQKRSQRTC
jgi:hypothetical protein